MTKKTPPPATDASDPLFGSAASEPTKALAAIPQTELAPGTFSGESKTTVARRGFEEIEQSRESVAVAAQIKAQIAARTLHAMQHPRSFDEARLAILEDCRRPSFAKAAIYRKPVGSSTIEGLSIRFAEAALRNYGNIDSGATVLYDGPDKRVIRVTVTDLERNTTHSRDIVLLKTIERKNSQGRVVVSSRTNSSGEITFEVLATEDELSVKEAAARSKVLRNEGLRLIPADILDEAREVCKATRTSADAKDPAGARKDIVDAFAEIGVKPARLEEFLGCPLDEAGPGQLGELREIFRAVRDGDATIGEFLEARANDINPNDDKPAGGSSVEALKEKARLAAQARKTAPKA